MPEIEYISFYFRENVAPYRSLEVRENKDGSLLIYLLAEESDELLTLFQSAQASDEKNRCRILDIRRGQTTTFEAPDFQSLYDQHEVYFRNRWTPVLERTGIQIDQSQVNFK